MIVTNVVTKQKQTRGLDHDNWIQYNANRIPQRAGAERLMVRQQQQHALGDDVIEAVLC